jgi:hypothetical protein
MYMKTPHWVTALDCLARRGASLRDQLHYGWSRQAEEAVAALRFHTGPNGDDAIARPVAQTSPSQAARADKREARGGAETLSLVAIVGGASSGKSTVFNNLLGGRLASRVTAKGHATLGPIVAVHESRREDVAAALASGLLLPSFSARVGSLDDNSPGEAGALHVVPHHIDALRNVLLFDMPDFTSELARLEGDVAHATLPWFERLIVIVDHERWFDRQTISRLRDESAQFGQQRFVVFNRDQEGHLGDEQLARLKQQADRLGAADYQILEFRRGRGCCVFPPGTFDRLLTHLGGSVPDRRTALVRTLGRLAANILNNNAERKARLARLREMLDRAGQCAVPSRTECFSAMLTAEERRHLDLVSRTLRITETRQWLSRQAERFRQTLRRHVPLLGIAGRPSDAISDNVPPGTADRPTIGWEVFRSRCLRHMGAVDAAAMDSDFWLEVRRWTTLEPPQSSPEAVESRREAARAAVVRMDEAIRAWTSKVEAECRGVSPRLVRALGAGTLAAAILLVAVAGPVTALTLPIITAKLAGALSTLAASAGAGAVAGPWMGRLLATVRERLVGSPEFAAVQTAVDGYRELIAAFGRDAADASFAAAQSLVIPEHDELAAALTTLCDAAEID